MRKFLVGLVGLVGLVVMAGCAERPHDATTVDKLPEIYPDYIGVTVPVGIAPLDFNMNDVDVDLIDVTILGSTKDSSGNLWYKISYDGGSYYIYGSYVTIVNNTETEKTNQNYM